MKGFPFFSFRCDRTYL